MLARKPLGASFVIFTPFCRIATGNLKICAFSASVKLQDVVMAYRLGANTTHK